jgi:hypothetical protein
MALHPFRTFRKHQKVIWGFLVVLCMITFVFMSGTGGRGDIFDRLTQWVKARRVTTPVTTLYGRVVDARQLTEVKFQRQVGQEGIFAAMSLALNQVSKDLNEAQQAASKGPDFKDGGKSFEKQMRLFGEQQALNSSLMTQVRTFQGATDTQGLLDFLVWRHQADQLGIQLDRDGVNAELKRQTQGHIDNVDDVVAALRKSSRYQATPDQVEKALADEFRVKIAQETLLGDNPAVQNAENLFQPSVGLHKVPAPVTPYEFWKYFEKQRTAVDVALVPVPVTVTAAKEPSSLEQMSETDRNEIQAMYNLYKDREAEPGQPEPGFKVPRKIKVAWVRAQLASDYYRKTAADLAQVLHAGQGLLAGGAALQTGGLPLVADPYFLNQYNELAGFGSRRFDLAGLSQADFPLSVYALRPQPADVAGAVGAATAGNLFQVPLGAVAEYQACTLVRNAKDRDVQALIAQENREKRIPFGVDVLLAGTRTAGPDPLAGGLTVAALAAYGLEAPQSVPAQSAVVRSVVREHELTVLARTLADTNLKNFQKDLENIRSRGATAEARARAVNDWLPGALKQYHLEMMPRPMTEARNRFDLAKSPALEPLKEALVRHPPQGAPLTPDLIDQTFASYLLEGQGNFEPVVWPPGATLGGAEAQPAFGAPQPEQDVFLVWRTADEPAKVPTFDQVQPEVIAAWRLQKARVATADRADELKAAFAKTGGDLKLVTQLTAEKKLPAPVTVDGIARQVTDTVPVASARRYSAFQFPKDLHATPNWVNDLLEKLKKKGDTAVVNDQAEKTYYVAVLLSRTPPSLETFREVYKDAAVQMTHDPMLDQLVQVKRLDYARNFTLQLRVAAGANRDGKFPIDAAYQKAQESRENNQGE